MQTINEIIDQDIRTLGGLAPSQRTMSATVRELLAERGITNPVEVNPIIRQARKAAAKRGISEYAFECKPFSQTETLEILGTGYAA